ncbi:MAG: TetR/AcrR family transcriptional regulator [Bacilli bacterium]
MGIMTFKNLKKDKRQRILAAAFEEFSPPPWEQILVSQVVLKAQSPRGSFYQYFDTLFDLFFVLLVSLFGRKLPLFNVFLSEANFDLKQALKGRFARIINQLEIYSSGYLLRNLLYFKTNRPKEVLMLAIDPSFDDDVMESILKNIKKPSPFLLKNLEKHFELCYLGYLEKPQEKDKIILYFNQILDLLLEKEEITRRKNEVIIKNI